MKFQALFVIFLSFIFAKEDFALNPMQEEINEISTPNLNQKPKISPLQKVINEAEEGAIITLDGGVYEGDIQIYKAITLQGKNGAHIKGSGAGDVIKIKANFVNILGLKITNSGNSHTEISSAISCDESNALRIEDNDIQDALFGVNFKQCNQSKIINNKITSKSVDLGLRGDAIRLWYSHENLIEKNEIYDSRDLVIWYSSNNEIRQNKAINSRYSLHFMYAGKNLVENNEFVNNSVGLFFMYSHGSLVRNNIIKDSTGAFGVGIGMKDTSDFEIVGNVLSRNARGFYLDQSPFQPGSINKFKNNSILYNTIGVQFHATLHKSEFKNNDFIGNIEVAINDTPGAKISQNEWSGNYFDEYEGFDRDKDGVGDIEFSYFTYVDSLWQYYPNLRLFYGSPAMSVLNFLAKLAPFSEPNLILSDFSVKMRPNNE